MVGSKTILEVAFGENIQVLPELEGAYMLYDEQKEVYQKRPVSPLRSMRRHMKKILWHKDLH